MKEESDANGTGDGWRVQWDVRQWNKAEITEISYDKCYCCIRHKKRIKSKVRSSGKS